MIGFEFLASPDIRGWEQGRDCATAPEGDLLWHFFPGDVIVTGEGVRMETPGVAVPALHVVASLIDSLLVLGGEEGSYEYAMTEADESILFTVHGHEVSLTCSFGSEEVRAPFAEYRLAVREFADRTLRSLVAAHPGLARNGFIDQVKSTLARA